MILNFNNSNIIEIQNIVYNSSNKIELEGSIRILYEAIKNIPKNTSIYLLFCHLLSVALQKMVEQEYCYEKDIIPNIKKAIHYNKEIIKYYPKIDESETLINPYISMLEEANSLCKLAKYEKNLEYYQKAFKLYKKIRINSNDKRLYYLTKMNEGIIYLELSKNKINILKNCKKSIQLSIEARNYLGEDTNGIISFFNQKEAEQLLNYYTKESIKITLKERKYPIGKINKPPTNEKELNPANYFKYFFIFKMKNRTNIFEKLERNYKRWEDKYD